MSLSQKPWEGDIYEIVDFFFDFINITFVQIDIIYNRLSVKLKSMLSIFGLFIFVLPTSFFIIYISIDMVAQSWSILEGSSEAGGMDLVFILKSFIPIMGILISIQTVSEIIKYFKAYKNER